MSDILVIDTSAGASAAWIGGIDSESPHVIRADSDDPRAHSETLALLIQQVLRDDDTDAPGERPVDAVAVGIGPAPFTGLRAGIVTAEAFAFARGIPLWGVASLDAIARSAFNASPSLLPDGVSSVTGRGDRLTVVTDARRKEVYAATYEREASGAVVRTSEYWVGKPGDLEVPEGSRLVGSGTALYPEELGGEDLAVDPLALAQLAWERAAAGVEQRARPLYLRRPDVHMPGGRKRATN